MTKDKLAGTMLSVEADTAKQIVHMLFGYHLSDWPHAIANREATAFFDNAGNDYSGYQEYMQVLNHINNKGLDYHWLAEALIALGARADVIDEAVKSVDGVQAVVNSLKQRR